MHWLLRTLRPRHAIHTHLTQEEINLYSRLKEAGKLVRQRASLAASELAAESSRRTTVNAGVAGASTAPSSGASLFKGQSLDTVRREQRALAKEIALLEQRVSQVSAQRDRMLQMHRAAQHQASTATELAEKTGAGPGGASSYASHGDVIPPLRAATEAVVGAGGATRGLETSLLRVVQAMEHVGATVAARAGAGEKSSEGGVESTPLLASLALDSYQHAESKFLHAVNQYLDKQFHSGLTEVRAHVCLLVF